MDSYFSMSFLQALSQSNQHVSVTSFLSAPIMFLMASLLLSCHLHESNFEQEPSPQMSSDFSLAGISFPQGANTRLREDLKEIVQIRGEKNQMDVWEVERMEDGSVRIKKSRKDRVVYPPGGAIEFWYQDKQGNWRRKLTA